MLFFGGYVSSLEGSTSTNAITTSGEICPLWFFWKKFFSSIESRVYYALNLQYAKDLFFRWDVEGI